MNRDRRPVIEQVKSGFRIVGKILVAFAIAVTFMAGCELVRMPRYSYPLVPGWVLIFMSVLVMTTTVKFWAAGFFGLIAYGALRCLGGVFVGGWPTSCHFFCGHYQDGGCPTHRAFRWVGSKDLNLASRLGSFFDFGVGAMRSERPCRPAKVGQPTAGEGFREIQAKIWPWMWE